MGALERQMDPVRPLAGITVVLVFSTALAAGLQLSGPSAPHRPPTAPVLTPTHPGTFTPLAPTAPTQPDQPVPPSNAPAAPQTLPPQALPFDPGAANPQLPATSPAPAAPPAQAAPPIPATPPVPPRPSVDRRPSAPTPEQLARTRDAQQHAMTYDRLRRRAILLCREWGFSQARCDTAPR